jgi:seryl-tRNA synthetase
MIDLKDLRDNPDKYRRGAQLKRMSVDIDQLLALDEKLRIAMTERENLAAEKNRIGKEIGSLAGRLKKAAADEAASLKIEMDRLQARPNEIKSREQELASVIADLEPQRDALWLLVPQPPDADVPVGSSADDNVEIRRWNPDGFDTRKTFAQNRGFEPKDHITLLENLGLVSFERGVKMAGSRSYVLTGLGMSLHMALLRFAFDFMTFDQGFTAASVPVLVRESLMTGTGFFPHGKEQAYHIANPTGEHELYLTGTGEVGLMGLHADEILDESALPLRYTTVSTCFRREAGSAGKETSGLYRIHQFDKVEQVVICKADEAQSRLWHQKMIGYVETILQRLLIPYRLLQCCTADLGPKNVDMIDLESWMPSRNGYGETHSASRLYDYQCRRLNIRYRETDSRRNVIAHSLNNTVLASPRIIIPVVEMHQNADGSITLPPALRPYMNNLEKIG